jgi:hypothetical protein
MATTSNGNYGTKKEIQTTKNDNNGLRCVSIPLIALLEKLYKESRGGAPDGPVRKSSATTD